MKNLKRCLAILLALVLAVGVLCACGKDSDNTDAPTTEASVSADTRNPEEIEAEKKLRERTIRSGQLLIHDPHSDVGITLQSDYFKKTNDLIQIATDSVKSNGTPFVTEVKKAGSAYIATIDKNFKYGDILHVTPTEPKGDVLRCNLHADDIDLNIDAESASSASFMLMDHYALIRDAHGLVSYSLMDFSDGSPSHLRIYGHMENAGDIKVYKDGNNYMVSAGTPIRGMHVMAMGMGGANDDKNQSADCPTASCVYQIAIGADGSVTITPQS